jgi:sulfur relay (sulfurtransferase) DsrF/TusC family protein
MAGDCRRSLALLVRTPPYRSREPRAELDVALAALTLDFELEVYFLGDALLQLAANKDGGDAGLPAGYKAWAALSELGTVRLFGESGWLRRCERLGTDLLLQVDGLGAARMKTRWRACDRVIVL